MQFRKFILYLILLAILVIPATESSAVWVWTPDNNKWENPKYSVKETPAEQLSYALTFYRAKRYKEAVREFNKLITHYPKAREAPEAQYYIGLCWEEQDKIYEAFKYYQVVIDKYPFSERSVEIVQREYKIGERLLENLDKQSAFIEALTGTNYTVIDVFKTVIKNAPYGPLAAPAQYKIGLYLSEQGLFQEARDEFEKVVNDYPESEWAKAAKYQIGLADAKRSTNSQYDQKITKSAVDEFKNFVKEYPDAELSAKAKDQIHDLREKEAQNNFIIAQFYEKQKNYKSAQIYYQTLVDNYKDSTWASKALERMREITSKVQ